MTQEEPQKPDISLDPEAEAKWTGQKGQVLSMRKELSQKIEQKISDSPRQYLQDIILETQRRVMDKTGLSEEELEKYAISHFLAGSTIDYGERPGFDLPGDVITKIFTQVFDREIQALEMFP